MTAFFKYPFKVLVSLLIAFPLLSASQTYALCIAYPNAASSLEEQAAKEVSRYTFLRTGTAPKLKRVKDYNDLPNGDVIVVAKNASPIITELKVEYGNVDAPNSDDRMGYIIKSIRKDNRNILVITGANTYATLNAAYRFAELLGCHFNLAGDIIPDKKISYPLKISGYDEKSQPWFELRGNLPFYNFTAGPDTWNTADYISFITQQAKMGLNFFGLHYYGRCSAPGELEGPEPHLWMGHKNDVNPDGTIKPEGAYKSYWASSFRSGGNENEDGELEHIWGEQPVSVSNFTSGTNKLFENDHFSSEAIGSKEPQTQEEMAAVFNSVGALLNESFTHAKRLGVKTAIGHEAPMGFEPGNPEFEAHIIEEDWIHSCLPEVQTRMRDVYGFTLPTKRGKKNEKFVKALYEGMFTRIMRTHPLDYYWAWTYECWAYNTHKPSREQIEAVADDYRYCNEVMKKIKAPFKMATFGWMVGSLESGNSLEFDDDLSKDVPFGTLWDMADGPEGIKKVIESGRKGWSSCWYEEDWGLTQPQLRLTHIYTEAAAALNAGGTQAWIAKHWRTNSVAHASAAHAQLSWDNRVSVSDPMPSIANGTKKIPIFNPFDTAIEDRPLEFKKWITDFYQNWAKANFGPERAKELGSLLAKADQMGEPKSVRKGIKGAVPKTARGLPSSIIEFYPEDGDPSSEDDENFQNSLQLYKEFCKYKNDIVGAGNIDRYMYWYHFFKGQIEYAKLAIYRGAYEDEETRNPKLKNKIIRTWNKMMNHETQRIRNRNEIAIIAHLQRSVWDHIFRDQLEIEEISTDYDGASALRAMPEISQIYTNENFEQKVLFIGNGKITDAKMHYRKLGSKDAFKRVDLIKVGNNIMKTELVKPTEDFEYYLTGIIGGKAVTYPVTGGSTPKSINKTVITVEK